MKSLLVVLLIAVCFISANSQNISISNDRVLLADSATVAKKVTDDLTGVLYSTAGVLTALSKIDTIEYMVNLSATASDSEWIVSPAKSGMILQSIKVALAKGDSSHINVSHWYAADSSYKNCLASAYQTTEYLLSAGSVVNGTASIGDVFKLRLDDVDGDGTKVVCQLIFRRIMP